MGLRTGADRGRREPKDVAILRAQRAGAAAVDEHARRRDNCELAQQ